LAILKLEHVDRHKNNDRGFITHNVRTGAYILLLRK